MRHDMTTYFDAVLDGSKKPLCNGSQEKVLEWLESRPSVQSEIKVCIGRTMEIVSVEEYLEQFG